PVSISNRLYHDDGGALVYAHSPSGVGWISFIEKAYAVLRGANSYNALNKPTALGKPPTARQVMEDVVGLSEQIDLIHECALPSNTMDMKLTDKHLEAVLSKARHSPTIAVSRKNSQGLPIVTDHTYAVMHFTEGHVQLRNPWDIEAPRETPADVRLSLEDFK